MRPTHFEDNILALLSYSSTQATWSAASTLARKCNVATRTVIKYLSGEYWDSFDHDYFGQIAYYYRMITRSEGAARPTTFRPFSEDTVKSRSPSY